MNTVKEPRSGSETVGGIAWLARMIDKARLDAAGEIDQFDLEYPCPMDQGLLARLEVEPEVFQEIAVAAKDDAAILEALKGVGAKL